MEFSFSSAAICSSARLRSRKTDCASSWLLQKLGSAARASRPFRRSRYCGASKITPDQSDAGFHSFEAILQIFENHVVCCCSLIFLQRSKCWTFENLSAVTKKEIPSDRVGIFNRCAPFLRQ